MITVKNPAAEVFRTWKAAIEPIVGEGNYSMEQSAVIAKTPYARIYMMGAPGNRWDLEGNESQVSVSFQSESFAAGEYAIEDAYDIDAASHEVFTALGFRRIFGPELITNIDSNIKRVISRYRRNYSGDFLRQA